MSLSFNTLRQANIERLPQFKNKHGGLAHTTEDGSDWIPSQWLQALVGEVGEYANERKKYERGDLTLEEFKVKAAKELADIQVYLDILARRCLDDPEIGYVDSHGIDLGQATIDKFNEVSDRVGADVYIKPVQFPASFFKKEDRSITPTKTIYVGSLPPDFKPTWELVPKDEVLKDEELEDFTVRTLYFGHNDV